MSSNCVHHHDVTVIGAGWSGLLACKYALEEGLSVATLERRENIGGVWFYSDDPGLSTVMKSTECTSSSTVTEMSDFPMPESMGLFPHHRDVIRYLHSYASKFGLHRHIKLSVEVQEVQKVDEQWRVRCTNGDEYVSKFLVVATGVMQKANRELEDTVLKGFAGRIHHAQEIKEPLEELRDKRLLVVGGGETGSDLCMEWYNHARFIYWSIPRGQHFFRKRAKLLPWGRPQALDKASSRAMKLIAPFYHSKPGLSWVCKYTTQGSLLAYQGHGIPEWKNDARFFRFFINKNGKVLDLVDYNHLVPKGGILSCSGNTVNFADSTTQEFDLIIMSTGYKTEYPFLPSRYANVRIRQRHKFVFDVEDPTIAFIGLVRPVVGSIVGISELQARWVAKVFSKHAPLKSLAERKKDVTADTAQWSEYFKNSSQRIEGLVEGFTYVDDIAKHAGIYPNYWNLFRRNPYHWFVATFSPYNAASLRLNEERHRAQAIATMQSHRKATLNPVHLMLIMFMRLIWFDWWLNQLSNIKYRIQVSSWWRNIQNWKIVRALCHLANLPKQSLYHPETHFKLPPR